MAYTLTVVVPSSAAVCDHLQGDRRPHRPVAKCAEPERGRQRQWFPTVCGKGPIRHLPCEHTAQLSTELLVKEGHTGSAFGSVQHLLNTDSAQMGPGTVPNLRVLIGLK